MTVTRDVLERLSPEKRALLALRLSEKRQEKAATASDHSQAVPEIVPDPDGRHEPFPLTGLQQAYWVGRDVAFEIGAAPSRAYVELACDGLDLARFDRAWQRLIARHDMLRVIVAADGRQQVLKEVPPFQVPVSDLRDMDAGQAAAQLEDTFRDMLQGERPTDQWPLFDVRVSRLDEERFHVHLCLDLLNFDGGSIAILFRELVQLYQDPRATLPPLELTFRDYVLATEAFGDSEMYRRSRDYWLDRLSSLPPAPQLPLAKNPATIARPWFVRRRAGLAPDAWQALKRRARQVGLTPTALLLAAYAEVLGYWSTDPRFCINIPLFNRLPLHPQVNDVVGDFSTVNLLEVDGTAADSFAGRARRVQEQLLKDLDHRYMDGVEVLRELARVDEAFAGRGIPVVFTSLLDHGFTEAISGLGEIVRSINQTAQVWMDLHVDEKDGALLVKWDAVEGLFPEGMVADMLAAYVQLLERLAEDGERWGESARQLLPPTQREQRAAINATDAPLPEGLLHTLFEEQVAQRPEQAAVIAPDRTLTYEDLYRRANRVGRRLRDLGAGPDQLVAVVMEKGWEQVVAAYGILQAGAAYLPVDPEFPRERIWHVLEHGQVALALTQSAVEEALPWPDDVQRLCVDRDQEWAGVDDGPLSPVQTQENLAYVLYTSGSTGLPKGVMLTHRGAVNRMVDVRRRFGIGPGDRALGLTALQHDLSVFDIFGMLGAGGTLVLPQASLRRDPAHWLALIRREGVTVWNSVPAFVEMFLAFLEHRRSDGVTLDSLRLCMMSGDWVPVSVPDRLRALAPKVQVISLGGPTETTTWDICYPIGTVDPRWKSIPYGRPMTNARYYVLNQALEPCPNWVTGELYIGGAGLARGFWRDEAKTQERFVRHPRTGERLYRSGDLGRFRPDGNIEFMGRADFQVKIRGQRIELGEIEATLEGHAAVRSAVVAAVGEARGGDKRLVAYLVANGDVALSTDELRRFLGDKLPDHMVPSAFVTLDQLPLSRNGKVDRKALPEPEPVAAEPDHGAQDGASGVTAQVARLVADVLQVPTPDPEANLLSLGANSIDMVRIGNQLENRFGIRPGMDQLFRLRTIAALAGFIQAQLPEGQKPAESVTAKTGVEARLASYDVLLDPEERDAFKEEQRGLRRDDNGQATIQLAIPEQSEALRRRYAERRSHRTFSLKPIPAAQFSQFLSSLSQITLDGKPKYLYASAGGLYPVQIYLHVKPGRVEGVGPGTYYYHPVAHRLTCLTADAEIDRSIHVPFVNTPTFDEAAFSIFFVTQLDAIGPLYGEHALRFSTLEAGNMAHLLETWAPACDIGLCQIGSVEFERIRDLFALQESHVLVHSMLGGRIDPGQNGAAEAEAARDEGDAEKMGRLLSRVKQLSDTEIRTLLDANR